MNKLKNFCPLCLNDNLSKYRSNISLQHQLFPSTSFELFLCNHCGSISTYPQPSDELLAKFYQQYYPYQWFLDFLFSKKKDAILRVSECEAFIHHKSRILDFGGGLGYLSNAFRLKGYNAVTYDPFAPGDCLKQGDSKWDVLIAVHVLEHSNNLDLILKNMIHLLVDNGSVILSVPNVFSKGYSHEGMRWTWAQPPITHLHHISENGLITLLERHGLVVKHVQYRERWDANEFSDIKFKFITCFFEKLYHLKGFKRFKLYRLCFAYLISKWRFLMLAMAERHGNQNVSSLSELQIVAQKVK